MLRSRKIGTPQLQGILYTRATCLWLPLKQNLTDVTRTWNTCRLCLQNRNPRPLSQQTGPPLIQPHGGQVGPHLHCDKVFPIIDVFCPHLYFRVPVFSVLTTFTQRMSIQSAMQSLHEYNNELTWSVCDE